LFAKQRQLTIKKRVYL